MHHLKSSCFVCEEPNKSSSKSYQEIMQFVIDTRGQDMLNQFIRDAVIMSRKVERYNISDEELEKDLKGWFLSQTRFMWPSGYASSCVTD